MPEQNGEKNQEATPYRRQKAREEGQVAKSQDLGAALLLVGAVGLLMFWGGQVAQFMGLLARRQLGQAPSLQVDIQSAAQQWTALVWELGKVMLPILLLLFLVAVLANVLQIGFLFLPQKLAFDFRRLNPLEGAKRIVSLNGLMRLVFGIFKVIVVASVALWCVWGQWERILTLCELDLLQTTTFIDQITLGTAMKVAVALLILAILEYGYQRWKYEQDLRMTTQELREEMKQLQGDPQILARRRAIQRQMVMNRMSSEVPKADVVVTNPTELAVALRYDPETMIAPIVVAKGAGTVAQRIRRIALENNVPVVERKPLAQALYKHVEIGQPIPSEHYAVVAEVLQYVYELKGETPPALRRDAA